MPRELDEDDVRVRPPRSTTPRTKLRPGHEDASVGIVVTVHRGRYVVLGVTFQFPTGDLSVPVSYAELARVLGIDVSGRAPMSEVRDAVLGLRRGKPMVLDPAAHPA